LFFILSENETNEYSFRSYFVTIHKKDEEHSKTNSTVKIIMLLSIIIKRSIAKLVQWINLK